MPIAPPSKSYNLVLSDSTSGSDDEEDENDRTLATRIPREEEELQQQQRLAERRREIELAVAAARAKQLEEETNSGRDDPSPSRKDHQPQSPSSSSPTNSSSKTAKNRKRRANRKKKQKAAKQRSAADAIKKHVTFDSTELWEFDRTIETSTGVPADGGWPLGMEWKDLGCRSKDEEESEKRIPTVVLSVDEYETAKQERLRIRWEKLNERKDQVVQLRKTKKGPFETRQLDYVRGESNPLFRPLVEDERRHLILEGEMLERKSSSSSRRNPTSNSQQKNGHHHTHGSIRRQRSNSFSHSHDNSHSKSSHITRSNSLNQSTSRWSSVEIRHIRNELEELRVHRTTEGSSGCTCRKLHVYLMPSDGSGGKKAQHKRLKPAKLVDELRKRHALPRNHTKMKRDELERLLHDIVEREGCCATDCECRRNGLQCSSDACSCWYDSHQAKDHPNTGDSPSPKEIQQRCGNHIYVVNADAISTYRQGLLCQVIEG